jgi:hypothetical protein
MTNPLVTRPPYGGGLARTPQAESKLPEGGPAGRGTSLNPDLPGERTFAKPVDDIRTPQRHDDESMYRVDSPADIPKEQTTPDIIDEEYVDSQPSFMEGVGQPSDTPKTKYPYRDGVPNVHNASADFVVALWRLSKAPVRRFAVWGEFRVGATSEAILSGLDGPTRQRALNCQTALKRADVKNLRWIFSVDCGNGPKAVKIRAVRPRANVTKFGRFDLELSCSCKAWQWLGPEYHARGEGYLLGKPQGTASPPNIKDPERVHKVCKHVAAALAVTDGWTVPTAKKKRK